MVLSAGTSSVHTGSAQRQREAACGQAGGLRVAQRVTMMHDGSIVVEGTPAEIRANELVHDLYLGRSHGA